MRDLKRARHMPSSAEQFRSAEGNDNHAYCIALVLTSRPPFAVGVGSRFK